jgi:hypothetical protein
VTAAVVIAWLGRGWFFFYDEWGTISYRRQGGFAAFFAAHNGHLQAAVIAIYRVLFATVGLRHYGAYRAVEIALHLVCAGLFYIYLRRRGVDPVVALCCYSSLLFLGIAWEVLFWPINAGFILPLICLLLVLISWDAGWRGSVTITALLSTLALASSGLGVAIVVGLGAEALLSRRGPRHLAALGVPLLGWIAWFLAIRPHLDPPHTLTRIPGASPHGDVGPVGTSLSNLRHLPRWLLHSLQDGLAAVTGTSSLVWAVVLGAAVMALLVWAKRRGTLNPRVIGLAIALGAFWVLTGLARAESQNPGASRYLYPAVLLLLLIVGESVRGVRLRLLLVGVLVVLTILGVQKNVSIMNAVGKSAVVAFAKQKSEMAQLEGCRDRLPPGYTPDRKAMPAVQAGPFWAATAALGDPVPAAAPGSDPMCPLGRRGST